MAFKSLSVLVGFQLLFLIFCVQSQQITNITLESLENYTFPNYANEEGGVFFITGGLPTTDNEFPFMAALGWINEAGELHFDGGGMLISPKMVLTAAHCVYKNDMTLKPLSVLVGFQLLFLTFFVHSYQLPNKTLESLQVNTTVPDYDDDDTFYITGGSPTIEDEFPFMAALGWINESGELHFDGGGMLISPKMVLTAAHCVYKNDKLPDIVFIGGRPVTEIDTLYFPKFSVVNVTVFPQYEPRLAYHDIAILELNDSISTNPVCLWDRPNLVTDNVTAIGYGLTQSAGMVSENLLKVNLKVFPAEICEPFYNWQRKFKAGISDGHICAGDKDAAKDTCQGDSGGPLIANHNEQMIAVGITSTGQPSCSGYPPAIYTKISTYLEWIAEVLKEKGQKLNECVI